MKIADTCKWVEAAIKAETQPLSTQGKWVEAAKAKRHNLKAHKISEVKQLKQEGVKTYTCKNMMMKKIDEHGNPFQHKCRASFWGFTECRWSDFHKTFTAVDSSTNVQLVIALATRADMQIHQLNMVG